MGSPNLSIVYHIVGIFDDTYPTTPKDPNKTQSWAGRVGLTRETFSAARASLAGNVAEASSNVGGVEPTPTFLHSLTTQLTLLLQNLQVFLLGERTVDARSICPLVVLY